MKVMSYEELKSYRLNSEVEPTDEMLEAIMMGVRDCARRTDAHVKKELARRFDCMKMEVARRRSLKVG